MLGYKDGKLQQVDTSGSWVLSFLIAALMFIPVWFLWKLIKYFFDYLFYSNKKKYVKVKKNKNWKNIPNNRKF